MMRCSYQKHCIAADMIFVTMQLEGQQFDAFFCSPLQRAAVTGGIIWAGRRGSPQARL